MYRCASAFICWCSRRCRCWIRTRRLACERDQCLASVDDLTRDAAESISARQSFSRRFPFVSPLSTDERPEALACLLRPLPPLSACWCREAAARAATGDHVGATVVARAADGAPCCLETSLPRLPPRGPGGVMEPLRRWPPSTVGRRSVAAGLVERCFTLRACLHRQLFFYNGALVVTTIGDAHALVTPSG